MSFLLRNRYPLMVVAVLALGCVLATYQYAHNEARHLKTRENFIHAARLEQTQPAEHLYQILIQSLSHLPEKTLLADWERLELMDLREPQAAGGLLAKYRTAVQNTLERRAQQRIRDLQRKDNSRKL